MKKGIFILLFIVLYLYSFSQDNSHYSSSQNKPLFVMISPIGLTRVSNIEFSEVKRTEYDKKYEVSSTPLILYMSSQKYYNYNFTIPSSFAVKTNGGKNEIVINLKVSNSFVDNILDGTGKEIIKVSGSFIMTPKNASGVYKSDQYLEIRVNSQ